MYKNVKSKGNIIREAFMTSENVNIPTKPRKRNRWNSLHDEIETANDAKHCYRIYDITQIIYKQMQAGKSRKG